MAEPARRRGGRPRKTSADAQSARIVTRLTPAENRRVRAAAARCGESLSRYLVTAGVERAGRQPAPSQVEVRVERDLDLRRIGVNLNETVRGLNKLTGTHWVDVSGVRTTVDALNASIGECQRKIAELLGGPR